MKDLFIIHPDEMKESIRNYIMRNLGLKPGRIVKNSPYDTTETEKVLRGMIANRSYNSPWTGRWWNPVC